MSLERKEKPNWFKLIDHVKAIRETGFKTARDLASELGLPEQRISEWIGGKKEPRAEVALEIKAWISKCEAEMSPAERMAYVKAQGTKPKRKK